MNGLKITSVFRSSPLRVGVLRGEGSGPELVDATCHVLRAVSEICGTKLAIEFGGEIGVEAERATGQALADEVASFCAEIFSDGGAVLAGAAGGRFVYDMRQRFALYYKLNPLRSYRELRDVRRIKLGDAPLDILLVRENLGGLYQGESHANSSPAGREVVHTFVTHEKQVRAVLKTAALAAHARRKSLTVIGKNSGVPAIHALWSGCALEVAEAIGVTLAVLDIDYAAYKLLHEPESFDVMVAPNCFGDILADIGGLLAGSRGLTFGASFSADGAAVYQTNHGAAYDLAGTNIANPAAQIFSAAMMLRETFGLSDEAVLIEDSVRAVWCAGWRTADIAQSDCRTVGTRQFADLVVREMQKAQVRNEFHFGTG